MLMLCALKTRALKRYDFPVDFPVLSLSNIQNNISYNISSICLSIFEEADALQKRLDLQANRLITTRKECHRRRLLLLAQQQLMVSGPQTYHQCPHCPKAFINAAFLNAHIHRRHAEFIASTTLKALDLNLPFPDAIDSAAGLLKDKSTPLVRLCVFQRLACC